MRREEIIAKGAYTAPQFGELVSVKQFIMLRQKGEKYLLLRLRNDRSERVDSVCFRVLQYDVKGNLVGTETVVNKRVCAEGCEDFTPDNKIKLNHACIDFMVEMVSATYGNYTYRLHDGELTATYEERDPVADAPVDKARLARKLHGKSGRVSVKPLRASKLMVFSMALVLLIIGLFAFLQLKNFMATEEFFTLDSIEYRFAGDNREDGPIIITSYKGKAGNIIVPTSIEGHIVEGIDDGAFAGRMLHTVIIKGPTYIGQGAFADCRYLDKVEMHQVTEIGAEAFRGCVALASMTLHSDISTIRASTFEGCCALTEVLLPEGLTTLEAKAFKDCKLLTSMTVPSTVTALGEKVFENCHALGTLTVPFLGGTSEESAELGYFFGGNQQVPSSLKTVTVTNVDEIAANAFAGCADIETIILPSTVGSIGARTFADCRSLTEITLPESLVSLGEQAFRNCVGLTDVTVPVGVRRIPEGCFWDCSGIWALTLPSALTNIGENAFFGCSKLQKLEIPASVTSMGAGILAGCTDLEELVLPFMGDGLGQEASLSSLFNGAQTRLSSVILLNATRVVDSAFEGFSGLTFVSLNQGIESIGRNAFKGCGSLQTLLLPSSVSEIGAGAFSNCTALKNLDLPAELTVISEGMFEGCSGLEEVGVPESVKIVESYAFAECAALKDATWLGQMESMGEYVFRFCVSLKNVSLPATLTKIENGSFMGCEALTEVSASGSVTVIGDQAFRGCFSMERFPVPGKIEEIGKEAFAGCSSLSSIQLPSTLQVLGERAFNDCGSIKYLTVPASVTVIGEKLLEGCYSLESLTVPFLGPDVSQAKSLSYLISSEISRKMKSVYVTSAESIANGAFQSFDAIETIVLNEGITSIGTSAFRECDSLTALDIPDTVQRIGENAFYACGSLSEITIPNGVSELQFGIFDGCVQLTKISVPFLGESRENPQALTYFFNGNIPRGLTEVALTDSVVVGDFAFQMCDGLEKITLAGDLVSIGQYAFAHCTSLTDIEIPEGVQTLGEYCFFSCNALETITVPTSVTQIGYNAFGYCQSLTELTIPFVGGSADDGNGLSYLFESSWSAPQSLKKVTVTNSTTVKDSAFSEMRYLEEIVYEQELESIGNSAFYACAALQTFAIPSTAVSIGNYAFYDCDALTDIEIPEGVEILGECCFCSCDGLETIMVPTSVTQIGYNAFGYCQSLTELTIPFVGGSADDGNGLAYLFENSWSAPQSLKKVTVTNSTTVKDGAFSEMGYLEEIVYEQELESIGNSAFYACAALQTFAIPSTAVSIGSYAFYNCDALTDIEIPEGVETLGECCFYSCNALETITVPTSATQIGYNAFGYCQSLTELTIPFVGGSEDDGNGLAYLFEGSWNVPQSLKKVTVTNSTTVKDSAFSEMGYLEEIVYEQEIESIGNSAFYACAALRTFAIPSTAVSIGNYAFNNCDALTDIEISEGVETLGERCFYSCDALEAIIVPTSVTQIGYNAFGYCQSLTELTIPFVGGSADDDNGLAYLFDGSWNMPQSLKKVTVTNSTTVKDSAFSEMGYLEEIVYEQEIESIGYYAFGGCNSMKRFVIPEACQWVSHDAFSGCYSLYEVYNKSALVFEPGDATRLLDHALVYRIDDTPVSRVTSNGVEILLGDDGMWYAIDYVGEDSAISFPSSFFFDDTEVTEYKIAQCAFRSRWDIQSVTIPEAIRAIGWEAFHDCIYLLEVYDLSSLEITRGDYENGCVAYYAYIVHEDEVEERLTEVQVDEFIFSKSGNHWFLTGYTGSESEVVLSGFTYEGETVSAYEIVKNAFNGNGTITSLVITDAVKTIGENAFSSMYNLNRVSFAENHSVTYLNPYTFAYCSNLFQVVLPSSLTDISYGAFSSCYRLAEIYNLSSLDLTIGSDAYGEVAKNAFIVHTSLNEPELVEVTIGDYVFWNTGDIWALKGYTGQEKHLALGAFTYNGITVDSYSICTSAFQNNDTIESVVLGNEVKQIGMYAFSDCSRLCRVSFEENTSITVIPSNSFSYCQSLDQVILPASLQEIGNNAFWSCSQLIEIYNLSSLELVLGDSSHGYVAYYAQVIHTSMSEVGLNIVNVESNGQIFKFKQEDGAWVLYAITSYPQYSRYEMPELIVDGEEIEYRVSNSLYMMNYNSYIIPDSVTYLDFSLLSTGWIYYGGTPEELSALANGFDLRGFSVYYYADCVHEQNQWTYDQNGNMTTGMNCSSYYVNSPTCQEKGVIEYTCNACGEVWQKEDDYLAPHVFNEENICEVCHAVYVSRPLDEMWTMTNDSVYPFEITEEGSIVSTNRDHGSRSTLALVATRDMLFTFRYYTETESGCDCLVISKNGEEIIRSSGSYAESAQAETIQVEAGDMITIAYVKDGSVSVSGDKVMLSNVVYLATE